MTRRCPRGFTLVELMVVVVILGVLAAVAIPSFVRFVKRSKTSEAVSNVAVIFRGQSIYYLHSQERGNSAPRFVHQAAQMPNTNPGATKYRANPTLWSNDPEWSAIGLVIESSHYYAYASPAGGSGTSARFTARAVGDLDGDNVNATFQRVGLVVQGEVQGNALQVTNELE